MSATGRPFAAQRLPQPFRAVGFTGLDVHLLDPLQQTGIVERTPTGPPVAPGVVATGRYAQHRAERAHRITGLVADPGVPPGSSRAKYAAAFFKISFSSFSRA